MIATTSAFENWN